MSWLDTLEDVRKKDFSQATPDERDKTAREVVNMASYACAVVAVSPIPFSDAVLMLPVQSAMVVTIGHIYGRRLTQAESKDLILELGTTAGVGLLARQGIKALLPVVGALLTVPAAFAANWAIGRVAMEYFRSPGVTKEQLHKVYESAKDEASSLFSRERFEQFRKKYFGKDDPSPANTAAADDAPASDADDEAGDDDDRAPDDTPDEPAKPKKSIGKKSVGKKKVRGSAKIVEFDFSKRLRADPALRGFDGVLHLDVSGDDPGQWTVDLRKDDDWVRAGLIGAPKLKLTLSSSTLSSLALGLTSAEAAVVAGAITIEPVDVALVRHIQPLFG